MKPLSWCPHSRQLLEFDLFVRLMHGRFTAICSDCRGRTQIAFEILGLLLNSLDLNGANAWKHDKLGGSLHISLRYWLDYRLLSHRKRRTVWGWHFEHRLSVFLSMRYQQANVPSFGIL